MVVRERRTAVDWAVEIQRLLDLDYPECETLTLICDQLNTHKPASLYAAKEAPYARRKV
ncbi:hypothetical protein [Moorena sp. SIO4A1]|uniref:hypothetical protein n=1 Tax=Moorena sp. SIO4A1 TaxID=2607835 RepID=UPI0025DDE218|nr:hypothetical protein [Moorena sp. SIO4A1]